ncbi:MAG: hypothetical protein HY738_16970 [Bacteroidia bacterium]|nr:hypothetical protein [Bacteroidia bacterium]
MTNQLHQSEETPSFEKVWLLIQETDRILTEKFQETREQMKETDRILTEKFQETDKKFQETDKKIKELADLFTGQWGKLVEALLGPNCIKLFQARGIAISQTHPNVHVSRGGKNMEIDILLVNDTEIVIVEIKTTAKISHIKKLIKTLKEFKTFFPHYFGCKVYGAVAALKYYEESDKYAEGKGLFVIHSRGEGLLEIKNVQGFKPKEF